VRRKDKHTMMDQKLIQSIWLQWQGNDMVISRGDKESKNDILNQAKQALM
jgi:hypothetical protein